MEFKFIMINCQWIMAVNMPRNCSLKFPVSVITMA